MGCACPSDEGSAGDPVAAWSGARLIAHRALPLAAVSNPCVDRGPGGSSGAKPHTCADAHMEQTGGSPGNVPLEGHGQAPRARSGGRLTAYRDPDTTQGKERRRSPCRLAIRSETTRLEESSDTDPQAAPPLRRPVCPACSGMQRTRTAWPCSDFDSKDAATGFLEAAHPGVG